jgi:hypothetical protein
MRHQSGTFYFAQRGTSHVAATFFPKGLTGAGFRRIVTGVLHSKSIELM